MITPITDAPFWIDVSSWQGRIDFVQMLKMVDCEPRELHGVIIRAGVGLEKDVQFERNWLKFKDIYRSSYWALHPDKNIKDQLDDWYQMNPEIVGIPRTIDLERDGGRTPAEIADITLHWSDIILSRDGVRPWIYSRKNLIDIWLDSWLDVDLNNHFYMLAEYNAGDGKEYDGIRFPNRVHESRVLLKQTTDKMTLYPGSGAIDRDRWLRGDVKQMNDYLQAIYFTPIAPPITPPVVPDGCEELAEQAGELYHLVAKLGGEIDANATEIEKWAGNLLELAASVTVEEAKINEQLEQDNDALVAQKEAIDELDDAFYALAKRVQVLETGVVPECNHSHRKFFSCLFNKK